MMLILSLSKAIQRDFSTLSRNFDELAGYISEFVVFAQFLLMICLFMRRLCQDNRMAGASGRG
jgi:hypothetical protein